MFGNVTALVGLHVTGKYREKHYAHMLQACGLRSSQGVPKGLQGECRTAGTHALL